MLNRHNGDLRIQSLLKHLSRLALAVILPSNAPGVNGLWLPALGFRTPVALKPGHGDPWTPLRLIAAFIKAGIPSKAFGFYPSDHEGSQALLRSRKKAMIFGSAQTVAPHLQNPSVQCYGPGHSKIIFGSDTSEQATSHLELLEHSVLYNGGKSCTNTSTIVVTEGGEKLARALASRMNHVLPKPLNDSQAQLAAFTDPAVAEAIDRDISRMLKQPGATDCSFELRQEPRHVVRDGLNFLLPTVIYCSDPEHPTAQVERPFPLVSVVEQKEDLIEAWLNKSLKVSAITQNEELMKSLWQSSKIGSLVQGPYSTTDTNWEQPHEGQIFELIHKTRAGSSMPRSTHQMDEP